MPRKRSYRDYNKYNDPIKEKANPKGFWDKEGKYRSGKSRGERKRKKCGAKKRRTGEPCQNWAMDNGRCRIHGGRAVNGGVKKGTKSALKTGEHETIWFDVLEDDEKLFVQELKLDAESQLNEELKLVTVRERRMMQRIKELAGEDFTITQQTLESESGFGKSGAIDLTKTSEVSEATLGQIQRIEEALTRVQEKKAKLIDLKLKVQQMNEGDDGAIDDLVRVLQASRNRVNKEKRKSEKMLAEEDDE